MKRRLLSIALVLLVLYACMVLLVWLAQDKMLFPGGPGRAVDKLSNIRVEWRELKDGTRFRIAIADPGPNPKGAMVFFTGNGEDLSSGIYWAQCFQEYGYRTVVPEYPGYGESGGSPSYESLNEMAEVAAMEARNLVRGTDLPLYAGGSSLGTFCAVHVASRGFGDKLLLGAPPTSVVDVGSQRFWWLPIRWIIRHPFNSLEKAPSINVPVLILHGDRDRIIPHEFGRRLAQAFPNGRLHTAKGFTHLDLHLNRSSPHGKLIESFLAE